MYNNIRIIKKNDERLIIAKDIYIINRLLFIK